MIKCPNCKTENLDSANFCKSCGSKLSVVKQSTPSSSSVNVTSANKEQESNIQGVLWIVAVIGIIIFGIVKSSDSSTTETPTSDATIESTVTAEQYVRPSTAPNGQPWPISAGYIDGYEKVNSSGLSSVTVDNTQNDSDVFVKLYALDAQQPYPVRHFFIPANSSFTINKVNVGNYDVRYQDLGTGALSRTEQFQIEEIDNGYGVEFSNLTLTIYKVQNGNMETYGLNPSEF